MRVRSRGAKATPAAAGTPRQTAETARVFHRAFGNARWGLLLPEGVQHRQALLDQHLATFGADAVYNQKDAEGFINLFGLPLLVQGLLNKEDR